jgi:hypothetical protein
MEKKKINSNAWNCRKSRVRNGESRSKTKKRITVIRR